MSKAIKTVVFLFIALKLLERGFLAYFNRMTLKRERYIKEQWLKRYEKTIPAWFDLTNK